MYRKLKKIMQLIWKDNDRIDQVTLYEVQDKLADVLLIVAEEESQMKDLVKSFPWVYEQK